MEPTRIRVHIRPAAAADAAAIAALAGQLGYPASPDIVAARLARILPRQDQLLVVAESHNQVCGWLQAHSAEVIESGFRVEVLGLVVAEELRRKGVGRELLAYAEAWAVKLEARVVVARTNINRSASQAFYTARGYTLSKTQAVYRKVPALVAGSSSDFVVCKPAPPTA